MADPLLTTSNTNSEITLQTTVKYLNLNQLLPTIFTSVLTITSYIELLDFEEIQVPYVHLAPEFSLGYPRADDEFRNEEATRMSYQFSGKSLRSSIYAVAYGSKTPQYYRWADSCYETNIKLWADYDDECDSPHLLYNKPNPFKDYIYNFGPQIVLLMVESKSPGMRHLEDFEIPMSQWSKEIYIANFVTGNLKPMLYIVGYEPSSSSGNAIISSVTLVCPSCKAELKRTCYSERFVNEDGEPDEGYRQYRLNLGEKANYWEDMRRAEMTISNGGRFHYWVFGNHDVDSSEDAKWEESCESYHRLASANRIHAFEEIADQIRVSLYPPEENLTEENLRCVAWTCSRLISNGLNIRNYASFYELVPRYGLVETGNDYIFITDHKVESINEAASLYTSPFGKWAWISFPSAIIFTCFVCSFMIRTEVKEPILKIFWRVLGFLAAYFVDQCPTDVPMGSNAVQETPQVKTRLRLITFGWMVAMLVVSNGYRGFLKATFLSQFAFVSPYNDWRNFSDFSLLLLEPNSSCSCEDQKAGFVDEVVILWEVKDRPTEMENCFLENKDIKLRYGHCFAPLKAVDVFLQQHKGFGRWLQRHEFKLHNEYVQIRCPADLPNTEFNECVTKAQELEVELESVVRMSDGLDSICLTDESLQNFSGKQYRTIVDKWRKVASQMGSKPWAWESPMQKSFEFGIGCQMKDLEFQYGYVNLSNDYEVAFWMTRKPKLAFVVHKTVFPWYWNIFKKAMLRDKSLRFAHTGSWELRRYSKNALYSRNDAPFLIYPKERYSESAKWTQRRVAAVQEAGLVNLWHKWDKILRPPRYERLNKEVPEEYNEVRPLKTDDPAINVVMYAAGVLWLAALITFASEMIQLLVAQG